MIFAISMEFNWIPKSTGTKSSFMVQVFRIFNPGRSDHFESKSSQNLSKEVEKRSIKRKKCTGEQARKSIYRYLYEGNIAGHQVVWEQSTSRKTLISWTLLSWIVFEPVKPTKEDWGLGSVLNESDHTIVRGKGRHVKSNKLKTDKEIDRYLSVGCLANDMKMSYSLFRTIVKAI